MQNVENPALGGALCKPLTISRVSTQGNGGWTPTKKLLLIMKLTAIILLSACLAASAKGHSQNVTLTLKDAPLEKVFSEIKRQTGYTFVYKTEVLANAKTVSLTVNNASLQQVLDLCFKEQPLTYKIFENTIAIKIKESPNPSTGSGQATAPPPIDISGKVTDKDGNPLEGATVAVNGTKNVTKTDASGVFVLKGLSEGDIITISYAEHIDQSHKVGATTSFLIKLERNEGNLQEVIINKGYYTEKQRNTVGNVTTVTAKDIEKQPVQNPLLALQGRVPGLEVTQLTGLNGGGVKIQIQGNNSIGSLGTNPITRTDPLIVVDGVPYPNQLVGGVSTAVVPVGFEQGYGLHGGSPLNYVNPSDIETIDILKDADATSLYGSRAANGAILITTKKGKAGKSKVSFNLQQGWGNVTRGVDMMNSQQYLSMRREALRNANQIASSNPSATAPFVYAPDLTIWDTARYTDWQKVFLGGTAKYTDINASVSGGTQSMQYLVGATYNRVTTVYPGDFDDKKGNIHFNFNVGGVEQRLRLGLSGSYMFDQNYLPVGSSTGTIDLTSAALRYAPVAPPIYNTDGSFNWAPNAAGTSTWTNPLAGFGNTDYTNTSKNLVSNLRINYRIVKGLDFISSIGYSNLQSKIFVPTRIEIQKPERRLTAQRSVGYTTRNMSSWIMEPQVNYENQLGNGKIQALIGTTIQKNDEEFLGIYASGFSSDQLMKTLLAAPTVSIGSSFTNTTRYNALFSRLNYTLNNKYILNLTARRDGSNRFGDNNKFSNFWSAGAAWIFTDEPWIQKHLWFLNFGKLRMSYGISGNDQIGDFAYVSTYNINNPPVLYQGGIAMIGNGIPNPNLQWEETRKWQSGVDLSFFKDRINLGFTYARNRSSNQLISSTLPAVTGSNSMVINLPALVQNTSLEFLINTMNLSGKNFSWTTSANLTIPRNKLVSFPGIENTVYKDISNTSGIVVGQPIGITLVTRYAGIDPATGRYSVFDKNGNPAFSASAMNVFVNLNPKYYGGLTNSFKYRGFQLDFLIQFVRKKGSRDMYWNNGILYPGMFNVESNQPVSVLDHWQKPGDNSFSDMYFTSAARGRGLITFTDAYYSYDASYARLKNVSLSWQLPNKWVQKMKMQSVRFYAHAQNLATITNYTGMDPESGGTGMPPLRMITTGVNIEF